MCRYRPTGTEQYVQRLHRVRIGLLIPLMPTTGVHPDDWDAAKAVFIKRLHDGPCPDLDDKPIVSPSDRAQVCTYTCGSGGLPPSFTFLCDSSR